MMKKSFDNTTYKHHQNKDQIQIISINSGTDAKSIDRYEVAFKRDDRVGAYIYNFSKSKLATTITFLAFNCSSQIIVL